MRRLILIALAGMIVVVCADRWMQAIAQSGGTQYPSAARITRDGTAVMVEDYAVLPQSKWSFDERNPPRNDFEGLPYQLARANVLASEPRDAPRSRARFFVIDQNGNLYILDKSRREFTEYIAFSKVFPNFANASPNGGFGTGLGSITFDPAYAKNGKFYTVHTEKPGMSASGTPRNGVLRGLRPGGFATTSPINPPAGEVGFESVVVEWTDTNTGNAVFEGTAREILRLGFSFVFHPVGDLLFNPLARPGEADYGNLYISVGDGTAGERPGITHTIPQRLDALQGKILRITPDVTLRPQDLLSSNGRYRIPSTGTNANPFVSTNGARPEVYAYGFRNPHRMTWDAVTNTLVAVEIGAGSWEEVNVIVKGGNYGWAEREGHEQVFVGGPNNGRTGSRVEPPVAFPAADTVIVEGIDRPLTPLYPAAAFSHRDGVAIGPGFLYRGKLMPQMLGKYLFSDIVTGRLFYCDGPEMLATKGARDKSAAIHELQVVYKGPFGTPEESGVKRRMFDIVAEAYSRRQGFPIPNNVLPGMSALTNAGQFDPYGAPYGGGRADVRLSMDGDGEIYLMSKSDGMIRKLTAVVTTPR